MLRIGFRPAPDSMGAVIFIAAAIAAQKQHTGCSEISLMVGVTGACGICFQAQGVIVCTSCFDLVLQKTLKDRQVPDHAVIAPGLHGLG